jgi:hypothetical protein
VGICPAGREEKNENCVFVSLKKIPRMNDLFHDAVVECLSSEIYYNLNNVAPKGRKTSRVLYSGPSSAKMQVISYIQVSITLTRQSLANPHHLIILPPRTTMLSLPISPAHASRSGSLE